MTFEEALPLLKKGVKMHRPGWNGKNMYVMIVIDHDHINVAHDYLEMKTAMDTFVPWQPSHLDIFADDWEMYNG